MSIRKSIYRISGERESAKDASTHARVSSDARVAGSGRKEKPRSPMTRHLYKHSYIVQNANQQSQCGVKWRKK